LPFLVPPESIDSESLILVLAFGAPSLLEAQCVFGDSARVSLECEDIAVADLKADRFKRYTELAGVHKIALPLPPVESPDFADAITFPEKNFNFSLSLYCTRGDEEAEYAELSEELLSTIRQSGLKKANLIRSRSGPELYSERVLSRSAMDFVVFPIGASSQWGVTVYVPETGPFKERSTERPYVTSGMSLSSRLARLLVNISGVSKGQVLLDPFCGSGTVLGEALLKGVDCIGIDRNHGSVERTKDNLTWVLSQDKSGRRAPSYSVVAGDATNIGRSLGDQTVDAIVSEPILMPRLSSPPTLDKAKRLIRHASFIYSEALHEMSGVLRHEGRMVLVTPSLRTAEGRDVALSFDDLDEIGLKPFQPPGGPPYQYPLPVAHQSTRWIRRMVYVLEQAELLRAHVGLQGDPSRDLDNPLGPVLLNPRGDRQPVGIPRECLPPLPGGPRARPRPLPVPSREGPRGQVQEYRHRMAHVECPVAGPRVHRGHQVALRELPVREAGGVPPKDDGRRVGPRQASGRLLRPHRGPAHVGPSSRPYRGRREQESVGPPHLRQRDDLCALQHVRPMRCVDRGRPHVALGFHEVEPLHAEVLHQARRLPQVDGVLRPNHGDA
jgi:tRNA G10  N-methylase Trm11